MSDKATLPDITKGGKVRRLQYLKLSESAASNRVKFTRIIHEKAAEVA